MKLLQEYSAEHVCLSYRMLQILKLHLVLAFSIKNAHLSYISTVLFLYCICTDPLASGQRKRLLSSDEEVETLSKRPKNHVTVQGTCMYTIFSE